MERCDVCGFDSGSVERADVGVRVGEAARALGSLLLEEPAHSMQRPEPEWWSMMEYGAHVRDVLLTIRDRLVIGLIEDDPSLKSMYQDERIDLGLYAADTPSAVAAELEAAASMFGRLFQAIDPQLLSRLVQYGYPGPQPRSLLWMGLQAVHECEHHFEDVTENLKRLSTGG